MAVKIRLALIGKKHEPFYRIVAIDSRAKRDGAALEILGTYDPRKKELIQFHSERIQKWVDNGAIVLDSVKKLQKLHKKSVAPKSDVAKVKAAKKAETVKKVKAPIAADKKAEPTKKVADSKKVETAKKKEAPKKAADKKVEAVKI